MNESLADNYARGGFGQALPWGRRPALLVIDFVQAYLVPGSPLYAGVEQTRTDCEVLLRAARVAGIPIIHTSVAYQPGGRDGGVFFRKVPALACFESGRHPELAQFASGLEPLAGETHIIKQYASAFFGTPLASTLTALGVDTVLIAGVSTSGCVRATVIDAFSNNYRVAVVGEGCFDRVELSHAINLCDMHAKYADVVGVEEALAFIGSLPKGMFELPGGLATAKRTVG
jgi:nicotinamidase-related amidase